MNNKKILLPAFIVLILAQLFVPAKMILDNENTLNTGIEYKFKVAPIDPTDPFRGKYITLFYDENTRTFQNEEDWKIDDEVYVLLTTDSAGFAKIKSLSKEKPVDNEDFVKATVGLILEDDKKIMIDFPFKRFYMEESKAYEAELLYDEIVQDSSQIAYTLVSVKNGNAVLKDVLINEVSIVDLVKNNRKK